MFWGHDLDTGGKTLMLKEEVWGLGQVCRVDIGDIGMYFRCKYKVWYAQSQCGDCVSPVLYRNLN